MAPVEIERFMMNAASLNCHDSAGVKQIFFPEDDACFTPQNCRDADNTYTYYLDATFIFNF